LAAPVLERLPLVEDVGAAARGEREAGGRGQVEVEVPELAHGAEARVPCLHAAHARHALVLREGVGGERRRERPALGAPAETRGQVAQVEGVVAGWVTAVVGRDDGGGRTVTTQ